jgi:uncharacterized protein (DUF983 family)
MSEAEAYHYCPKCGRETVHMFSGSLTKGACSECGNKLPENEKADTKRCFSYSG